LENLIKELVREQDFAIGNDVVYLPSFKESFNPLFQKKVYTPKEIYYCEQFEDSLLRYASTWAAKEAVYKAVKQIIKDPLPFKRIEILRKKIAGRPHVILPENLKHFSISLSITHDGDYVWAASILKR